MTANITIVDYNPAWPDLFKRERETLLAVIGDHVVAVEHIGSTAVPGLAAKPVIDIMVAVDTLAEADAYCIKPIITLGYEYVKAFEKDMPFRRYFRKDDREGTRTHQIHLVEMGSDWWIRHLAFRDYLRAHNDARDAYEQLKRELATRDFATVSEYADAKTDFIRSVEEKALAWQRNVSTIMRQLRTEFTL